jgi:S1-C subfamily serine protease
MSSSPNRKRPAQRITGTGIALIVMGVVGSVLSVVVLVLVLVFWVSKTWVAGETAAEPEAAEARGNAFPMAREGNGPVARPPEAEKEKAANLRLPPPPPLPPAPRPLEFLSPLPPELTGAPVAEAPAPVELDAAVVQKVKQATVHLRVTLPDGGVGQGSGFFALEPGLVLTNAHVVGMLHPDSPRPRRIEVIQNSGTGNEKKYPAELLGVDRHSDLAVLRVATAGVPAPLEVRSARNLRETQRVWVVGFPLGDRLGKEITVSDSSVSSLRREENGLLSRVQVNGGMHPGNSGGPVVDGHGDVVGVAVSGFRGTQINFAVPGDYVRLILKGRIAAFSIGQPVTRDGKTRVTVSLSTVDPLRRMRQPVLEVWTGDPAPAWRAAATNRPAVLAGDSPHQRQALTYQDQAAHGEMVLPALPPGKAYWLQPSWTDRAGGSRWATARVCSMPTAVAAQPAGLFLKHQVGTNPLVLNKWLTLQVSDSLRGDSTVAFNSETRLAESVQAIDDQEQASIQLRYRDYNVEARLDGQPYAQDPQLPQLRQDIGALTAYLQVDRHGNPVSRRADPAGLPARSFQRLESILRDTEVIIEGMSIPLPNKQVTPGETWQGERTLAVDVRGPWVHSDIFDTTYTYLGSRHGSAGDQGVIALQGKLRDGAAQANRRHGRTEGLAVVDLPSGRVLRVDALFTFELEAKAQNGATSRTSGAMNVRLQRGSPELAKRGEPAPASP